MIVALVMKPVARSMFQATCREGIHQKVYAIQIASTSPKDIELATSALQFLSERQPRQFKIIVGWLRCLSFERRFPWRKHFCDGTLFIESQTVLPPDRLAAYLYRIALQNMLFNRFRRHEVLLNDARTNLIVYRRELDLIRQLGCSESYVTEQQLLVERLAESIPDRERKRAKANRCD